MPDRKAGKLADLLEKHKAEVIEQLGPRAFDILTPHETAAGAGIREFAGDIGRQNAGKSYLKQPSP